MDWLFGNFQQSCTFDPNAAGQAAQIAAAQNWYAQHPIKPRPDLGPRQLRWLKDNIPAFDRAWSASKAADENAAKQNAKVLGK